MIHTITAKSIEEITSYDAVSALEQGSLILLPKLAFLLTDEEKKLFDYHWTEGKSKNISFNLATRQLKAHRADFAMQKNLTSMMERYANFAQQCVETIIPQYKTALLLKRTSFRPIEASGRKAASYRKDDTRLHVDAFPANPTQGARILRVFSNINPYQQPRIWKVGEAFPELAGRFLPSLQRPWRIRKYILKMMGITKNLSTDYDALMLQLHDKMKADLNYQKSVSQQEITLPANSTWIVFTDCTSHAALAGQYCLEQTFSLPVDAMQDASYSPLKILENKFNTPLTNRPSSKLAPERKVEGGSARRTGVYTPVHEDSSVEPTHKFSTGVEFQKRSNV